MYTEQYIEQYACNTRAIKRLINRLAGSKNSQSAAKKSTQALEEHEAILIRNKHCFLTTSVHTRICK